MMTVVNYATLLVLLFFSSMSLCLERSLKSYPTYLSKTNSANSSDVDSRPILMLGYLTGSQWDPEDDTFPYRYGRWISGAITMAVDEINADDKVRCSITALCIIRGVQHTKV